MSIPSGPSPSTLAEFQIISQGKRSRIPRRRVIVRVMHPRRLDNPMRGPGRRVQRPRGRVRSPRCAASEVNAMLGAQRTRYVPNTCRFVAIYL